MSRAPWPVERGGCQLDTEGKLNGLKEKKQKLLDLLLDGTIDRDTYREQTDTIDGKPRQA